MFTFGLLALIAAPRSPSPGTHYARNSVFVPAARRAIVNGQAGANMAAAGFYRAWVRHSGMVRGTGPGNDGFMIEPCLAPTSGCPGRISSRARNLLAASALKIPALSAQSRPTIKEFSLR
jgi:hypothetical protein